MGLEAKSMQAVRALESLPCPLRCERREAALQAGAQSPCAERCERFAQLAEALHGLTHPAVPFEELVRAIYLADHGADPRCFLDCAQVHAGEDFVKGVPASCYERCEAWRRVREALPIVRRELTFEQFKTSLIKLHLAVGTDVSTLMFIRLFEQPERTRPALPPRLVLPPAAEPRATPGLAIRFCRINRWMLALRFLLAVVVLGSAALLQNVLRLDFAYGALYAAAGALLALNLGFWLYQRGHQRQRLPYSAACPLCTPGYSQVQIAADYAVLAVLVAYSGGLVSPAILFLFPHIVFSALLLSWRRRVVTTGLALAVPGVMLILHFSELLPRNDLLQALTSLQLHPGAYFVLWLGLSFYLGLVHYFTLRLSRELWDWQHEVLELHDLLAERSRIQTTLNARLERIDQIRRRMVNVASHDLKAPLNAVEGHLKVMLGGYYGALSDRQIQVLQRSMQRLASMRDFIREILDVATLEKEGLKSELAVVDVRDCITQVEEDCRWAAEDQGIRLSFEVPRTLPPVVASPTRFRQVLQNLVTNAIKFTPVGGEITVTVVPGDTDVRFAVRDTGPGIPPQDLEHVFTEFYRVKTAKQSDPGGSGLGLYIVKSIVNAHGGEIWAESEVGQGSTFFFTLRRGAPPAGPGCVDGT